MDIDASLTLLSKRPETPLDVAEVALWLARDEYPELDVEASLGELTGMAHEARRYLKGDLETRVRYIPSWILLDDSSYMQRTRPEVPDTPRADLRESHTVEGVVVSCHIVPVTTEQHTATYLTLDETPAR